MASSLQLQAEFETLCKNVYFQPPSSFRIEYPCIIFKRDMGVSRFADNKRFFFQDRYEVTVIDSDPERSIAQKLRMHFTKCRDERNYISDNLYHDVFELYY